MSENQEAAENRSRQSSQENGDLEDLEMESSSINTGLLRGLWARANGNAASGEAKTDTARPRPSLGALKVEKFAGTEGQKGHFYRRWKKDIQAQKELYQMDEAELALLV
mgnify:CR=1 FL=1